MSPALVGLCRDLARQDHPADALVQIRVIYNVRESANGERSYDSTKTVHLTLDEARRAVLKIAAQEKLQREAS